MNCIVKSILVASMIAAPLSARAAFMADFSGAVPGGGTGNDPVANPTNFGAQLGWTISDPTGELSFVYPPVGPYGQSVALGGYWSTPTAASTTLGHFLSEPAVGVTGNGFFKVDFALINDDGTLNFFTNDDKFGFSLSDSSGPVIAINFEPTIDEAIRSINTVVGPTTTMLQPNGISPSSYASPSFYTLSLNFTKSGADLAYTGSVSGVTLPGFSGIITGKADTTFTAVGINFMVTDPDPSNAGSNFLIVTGLSIPEPSVTLTGLMSLGLLSLRRRR